MLSKEVTNIIETAVLNGNEVKVTIEISKANPATESRLHENKVRAYPYGKVPPPAPPALPPRDSKPHIERPKIRTVTESGCLVYIIAGILSIGATIYLI